MPRAARLAKQRLSSDALLLRRTAVGDADLVVQLFTEAAGTVSAVARGARRSTKRLAALEPMHVLRVALEISPARELATLSEASLARPRLGLTSRLSSMEAAGRALRWLRRAAPPRTPEPGLWREVNALLDDLDGADADHAEALAAATGLRLLAVAGWGLELVRCVRCGKPAPPRARAILDVRAGGLVCRSCGGVGPAIGSRQRLSLVDAVAGAAALLSPDDARLAIDLVDQALTAHGREEAT